MSLEFPELNGIDEPRFRAMTLQEYARFCEFCLANNPSITPENCMTTRMDEAEITVAFHFPDPGP